MILVIPQHKHTRMHKKIGLLFSGRLVRPFLMMMEPKQGAKKKKNNERRHKDSLEFSDTSGKAISKREKSSIFAAVSFLSSLVNNTNRSGVAQFSSGARSSRLPSSAFRSVFRFLCFSSLLFLQQKAQAGKKIKT